MTREILKPTLPESILFFNEKYCDEIRLAVYVLSPISCLFMLIRITKYFWKKNKDKVCFECVKMPLEHGCPKCSDDIDFIILFNEIFESITTSIATFFDKCYNLDFIDDPT